MSNCIILKKFKIFKLDCLFNIVMIILFLNFKLEYKNILEFLIFVSCVNLIYKKLKNKFSA